MAQTLTLGPEGGTIVPTSNTKRRRAVPLRKGGRAGKHLGVRDYETVLTEFQFVHLHQTASGTFASSWPDDSDRASIWPSLACNGAYCIPATRAAEASPFPLAPSPQRMILVANSNGGPTTSCTT